MIYLIKSFEAGVRIFNDSWFGSKFQIKIKSFKKLNCCNIKFATWIFKLSEILEWPRLPQLLLSALQNFNSFILPSTSWRTAFQSNSHRSAWFANNESACRPINLMGNCELWTSELERAAPSFQLFEPIQFAERAPLAVVAAADTAKVRNNALHFSVTQLLRLKGKVSDRVPCAPAKRPGHALPRGGGRRSLGQAGGRETKQLTPRVSENASCPARPMADGRAPD